MKKRFLKCVTAAVLLLSVLAVAVGCAAGEEMGDENNLLGGFDEFLGNYGADMEGGGNKVENLPGIGVDDEMGDVGDAGIETGDVTNGAGAEDEDVETDEERPFLENAFTETKDHPTSTFSADVDTASYTYFRKLINNGYRWNELTRFSSAFRTEEFINYFSYTAPEVAEGETFGVGSSIFPCPWNEESVLLRVTLHAKDAEPTAGNNLVFLIDVSGSMSSADKLPLLQNAFSQLTEQLTERDRVSIVTYSGGEAVVLEGCEGSKKETILAAIHSLSASGSTNGEAGLRRAYEIAEDYYIEGGNNRIIMASDGDLNVGISSADELISYISNQRDQGVYLSVLGFGTGNYRDQNMEALADHGNGIYYYIDGVSEAERVFGSDILSTLYTVAEDVKLQITFKEDFVSAYRLIGYENRMLADDDFTDDTKDAGEVGAGHTVTVCYELKLNNAEGGDDASWLDLSINYKHPGEDTSVFPRTYAIGAADYRAQMTEDERFLVCVIETCMLLHESTYLEKDFSVEEIITELSMLDLHGDPEREEFLALLREAA